MAFGMKPKETPRMTSAFGFVPAFKVPLASLRAIISIFRTVDSISGP